MAPRHSLSDLLSKIEGGERFPVYLIVGDLVVAEPAALQLAEALAGEDGRPQVYRRPPTLAPLFDDLQTYSLFGGGKVLVAVDSAVLADRKSAGALVGEALSVGRPSGDSLAGNQREAASRLVQALHLFGVDPQRGTAAEAVEGLPDWSLAGAKGGRVGKAQARSRREDLAALLESARQEGLRGIGSEGVARLDDLLRRGLPDGHALVLVERGVDGDHPLATRLRQQGSWLELTSVRSEKRGGWSGVDALAAQLESELGVGIRRDALEELTRRTLKATSGRSRDGAASAESTGRFAAEYRKLAELVPGGTIDRELVARVVTDRGEEDVWKLLDAVGEGRVGEALRRLDRLLAGSNDASGELFSFFSLFAGFCRQLTLVRGVAETVGVRAGERNYRNFKDRVAPRLTGDLPGGGRNPLAGTHPFRLHRAYLAAFRLPAATVARLPEWVLEAEMALKGESGRPTAALAALIGRFAA